MASSRWNVFGTGIGLLFVALAGAHADPLTITATPNPGVAGLSVTFSFSPKVLASGDTVDFNFGDGATGSIAYTVACSLLGGCGTISHVYAGPMIANVSASGTLAGHSVSGSLALTITESPDDSHLYIATGAHNKGFNGTQWRTDVWVDNPGTSTATYTIALLARNQANPTPANQTYSLKPGAAVAYHDILLSAFGFSGAAALRIIPMTGAILATSRTYDQLTVGTYGQFVPAVVRSRAIAFGQDARLLGLSHEPSLVTGFRTNIGLVNASPAPISVEIAFYQGGGVYLATKDYNLTTYEFVQLDKAFEAVTPEVVTDGLAVVRTTTAGARFLAYASVIDNVTGDPMFVPAQLPQ
ncbi:MAG: hypothetical protein ACHQQS_11300 [Thermoanaerobaculales bacterium]